MTTHLGAVKVRLMLGFLWTNSVQDFLVCHFIGAKKVAGEEMKEIIKKINN